MSAEVKFHEFRKHDYEQWTRPDLTVIHVKQGSQAFVDIKVEGEGTLHLETAEMIQGLVDTLAEAGYVVKGRNASN